jgi:hypothetical protein
VKYLNRKPLPSSEPRTQETPEKRGRAYSVDGHGGDPHEWPDTLDSVDYRQLSLEGDAPLGIKQEDSFNPYDHTPGNRPNSERPVKRDLRKLSEWIKAMREIEERKARGEDEE